MKIPSNPSSEGWVEIYAEIKTNNFEGEIRPSVEVYDILNFLSKLEELYKLLKGSASFEPSEKQLTFTLEAHSGGQIEATGVAWSEACYGTKLEFCFLLDQTFL